MSIGLRAFVRYFVPWLCIQPYTLFVLVIAIVFAIVLSYIEDLLAGHGFMGGGGGVTFFWVGCLS
jgi:uncharacterized membrane protein (DUF106 family)